jgi:hypothetical protein
MMVACRFAGRTIASKVRTNVVALCAAFRKRCEGQAVGDDALDIIVCPRFAVVVSDAHIERV